MMELQSLGKYLLLCGIVLALIGGLLMLADKIPYLGRLPGDIYIKREHFSFYFPLATCIILSIILTIILNLLGRR